MVSSIVVLPDLPDSTLEKCGVFPVRYLSDYRRGYLHKKAVPTAMKSMKCESHHIPATLLKYVLALLPFFIWVNYNDLTAISLES